MTTRVNTKKRRSLPWANRGILIVLAMPLCPNGIDSKKAGVAKEIRGEKGRKLRTLANAFTIEPSILKGMQERRLGMVSASNPRKSLFGEENMDSRKMYGEVLPFSPV